MKNVILSADGPCAVYAVADIVAEHLDEYCLEFCSTWLHTSPHAKKYRRSKGVCFNETDFIDYLNKWLFPEAHSSRIETLGWIGPDDPIPEKYKTCPQFNF